MRKSLIFLSILFYFNSYGQVLCVKCYNQNVRVLSDTNDLILNGGFENSTCNPHYIDTYDSSFCPNSRYYYCDILNWTCTGGGINTYANICDTSSSIIAEGIKAAYFG